MAEAQSLINWNKTFLCVHRLRQPPSELPLFFQNFGQNPEIRLTVVQLLVHYWGSRSPK